jgi:hypothetical protein
MKKKEEQQEWVFEATKWLLTQMGYDVSKDIHKQFMKKHGEKIENRKPYVRRKPYQKDYFQKFI